VRFLVDAQLPPRLAIQLIDAGHDVVHSMELPDGNRTSDVELATIADREDRIMVTKDRDFEVSHLLGSPPGKLLLVTTGNVANSALLELFASAMDDVEEAFVHSRYVEVSATSLIVHGTNART
jgi:predicted nuclease of predicted toxin-antitoxin system